MKKLTLFILLMSITTTLTLTGCDKKSKRSKNFENPKAGLGENQLARYKIDANTLAPTLIAGKEDTAHIESWNKTIAILPHELLKAHIREYVAFSDGVGETLAYVTNSDLEKNKWVFAIDAKDANDSSFNATIIHEYAHILALEIGQIDKSYDKNSCPHYYISEGCTKQSSYLNTFHDIFWNNTYPNHPEKLKVAKDKLDAAIEEFYLANKDDFVSHYAVTNPIEDFAEVFSNFVTTERQVGTPSLIKDQKIGSFYNYPNLVTTRTYIRGKIKK